MYSSHYNERLNWGRDECVSGCVAVLLRSFWAKPLCRCVQYAKSSGGIVTLRYEYSKVKACYRRTVPWFWGSTCSNSLQYMCSRTEEIRDRFFLKYSPSNVLQPSFQPLGKHLAATNTVKWECDRKYCWKSWRQNTKTPVPPCSYTAIIPPPHKSPEEK